MANKEGRGDKTSYYQRLRMVEWLEAPPGDNFKLITGDGQGKMKNVVAGAKLKKKDAYTELADFVNQQCGSSWTAENAQSRYRAYLKLYKETRRNIDDGSKEKFCLGPDDFSKGIDTIEKKIEKLCPFYYRLETLYGSKQNIIPSFVYESGQPLSTNTGSNKVDDDNDDENCFDNELAEMRQQDELLRLTTLPESFQKDESFESISSIKKRSPSSTSSEVHSMAAESFDDLGGKLAHIKKQRNNKDKEFHYQFNDNKLQEIELQRERFRWEREFEEKKILNEQIAKEKECKEETKRTIISKLIDQNKSPEEIKDYLKAFNFDM